VRWRDILGLALSALWQQKVRTLLTLLGVLFGVFVLAASLAIGQGVQDAIRRYAAQNEILRRVEVTTRWDDDPSEPTTQISVPGEMSDARRDRLRRALARHRALTRGRQERVTLSEDVLKKLAALPHVEAVVPLPLMRGFAVLGANDGGGADSHPVLLNAARPRDPDAMKRLVAGRFFERADEPSVVVSEFLLYQLGLRDESTAHAALGRKLRLEFRTPFGEAGFAVFVVRPQGGQQTREEAAALDKVRRQLPDALDKFDLEPQDVSVLRRAVATTAPTRRAELLAREYTIAGVMRAQTEEETQAPWDPFRIDADVVLPYDTATALFFDSPGGREEGVWRAVAIADRDENVKAVLDDVRKLGLRGHGAVEFIERQRLMFLLIFGGMTCVAAVAMIVAALGITNTMLISVLERTREIGIMKAVGARSGHLQTIFLVEGALIGAVGGALGLLLAWAASFPGDAWVRRIASQKLGTVIIDSIFVFPAWLQFAVISAATLVTVLAAVYPARRAARLDPVTALRHE
jgi:putative ABC transport system permease protein